MSDERTITLKVPGQPVAQPALPRLLQTRTRAAGAAADDPFLPRHYVRPVEAIDLSATSRAAAGGIDEPMAAKPGQVIALELADGVVVFTSPENLKDTLERVAPQAIDDDGDVHLDKLKERAVASRGLVDTVSNLIVRVTTLDVGTAGDAIIEAAQRKALEWLREKGQEKLAEYAELGVSWLGTKALMWAIESRLPRQPGLYHWAEPQADAAAPIKAGDPQLAAALTQGPALVFIHGTGSSTAGSFSDLQTASRTYWAPFETHFGERIFAFEHRTLSESPIENALQLASVLPERARINLVTHSRGGLVGDLLCLDRLDGADQALIEAFAVDEVALGAVEGEERERLRRELERAYAEQRAQLRELAAVLRRKQLVIERYVRVACPARGTRLASGNFDVFISGLLSLIGLVPALAASPLYSAFKRVVLEIAKNRTRPNLVPGIEAMLPESPMARLLARATPQRGTALAVVAGDIEGGGLLKRLGVLFTDYAFFAGVDNDLVVDTDSMYAGVARPEQARVLFDQGPDVSHFRYFTNDGTRTALRRWLLEANVGAIDDFAPLAALAAEVSVQEQRARDEARRRTRGGDAAAVPVVVVLPGIMGSHLWRQRKDRVWFDFDDLVLGGLEKLRFAGKNIEAEKLFDMYYGDLCDHLAESHQVERFPYDWRQPLDVLADALAARLRPLLYATATPARPVRILAHSMGGLVVRALVHKHPKLWDELMQRDGARFIMLGTPNQGSHLMVETLIGKASSVRMLGRLDVTHNLQGVLDIVAEFPGALQLLPRPGFEDTAADYDVDSFSADFFTVDVWRRFKGEIRDFWFGNGVVGEPNEQTLAAASWLWRQDAGAPSLPAAHQAKVYYVRGCASSTSCGITDRDGKRKGRWKMLGTPYGDGTVTWASGEIPGIGTTLYMRAEHGALADTGDYFESLASLLLRGERGELLKDAPRVRGAADERPLAYDAGPPIVPTAVDLAASLVGRQPPARGRKKTVPTLEVHVCAMDLRWTTYPIIVGHYEQDPIAGAEAVVDRTLVNGALSMRYNLGMYAGPLGSATVVLRPRNEMERRRGSHRGAVVAGLGKYDGSLSVGVLTEAVRTATLRYLLHVVDTSPEIAAGGEVGVPLASLLLGYNSSANLTVSDAMSALLRGVVEANRKFAQTSTAKVRVSELQIVELYIDTAIAATYALPQVAKALNDTPGAPWRITFDPVVHHGEGLRQRLDDARGASYWPRLVVTDAERREDECPPECYDSPAPNQPVPGSPTDASGGLVPVPDPRLPGRRRLVPPERLRFLYLGQRARAETVVHQRQPGLVETLVAQQMHLQRYHPDLSRMLFQLLMPHDFKDTARGLDRVVMVVDGYTANLPWELMLADEVPLAVKTSVVRQFSSSRFRLHTQQTVDRRAFVVGNPSSRGFAEAFPGTSDPPPLPAAENEARTVVQVLGKHGYGVIDAIGDDQLAIDVLGRLYQHPYRVLHIATHGIYGQMHRDGVARSGVVLSDGLLITAAEIGGMEVVPDLVFLNCCHLGKVDRTPTAFNRLAYSVARELIEMGVRAVVVAGWAVDDEAASVFAQTFYDAILGRQQTFGDAVFAARRTVWERFPNSVTWGAYQAYGDPGWQLEPRRDDYASARMSAPKAVAPEELIATLDRRRIDVARSEQISTKAERRRTAQEIETLLREVADEKWLQRLDVCTALGQVYGSLGAEYFGHAADWLRRAVEGHDAIGAPIEAIEQLANFEARDGERHDDLPTIERAIARLEELVCAVAGRRGDALPPPHEVNRERSGLLGSAYKRLAVVHARRALSADGDKRAAAVAAMRQALLASSRWYDRPRAQALEAAKPDTYLGLNWLLLQPVVPDATVLAAERSAFADRCAEVAAAAFPHEATFWNAIAPADAQLAKALFDGELARPDTSAHCVEQLATRYLAAMQGVQTTPRELDSTLQGICFLALFCAAIAAAEDAPAAKATADALQALANRLAPSGWEMTCIVPAAVAPAGAGAAPARPAARARTRKSRKKPR